MDAKLDWGDPSVGPRAVPGVYTVRLTAAGRTLERKVTITPDPRSTVSQADLEAQLALALGIRDDVSRLTDMVESLRSLRQQLQDRIETLADDDRAAALVRDSKALVERLDAHENEMHNPTAEVACDILAMKGGARLYSRLSPLAGWIAEAGGAPTQGMREVYAAQKQELDGYASRFDGLLSVDLAGLNRQAQSLGIGYVVIR